MTTLAQLRKTALSLPETTEHGIHLGMVTFTVRDKQFASMGEDNYVQLHLPVAEADEILAVHWLSRAPKRLAAQVAAGEVGDLPKAIGKPATQALISAGITTLTQVAELTEADLLAMHGVGPKAVRILSETLSATGRPLKD